MNEMTAGEAAKILEALPNNSDEYKQYAEVNPNYILISPYCMKAFNVAASILRRVESGELREVVHAHWNGWTTSAYIGSEDEFGDPKYADRKFFRCSKCRYGSVIKSHYCPSCGALMDGKDDGHETD